MKILVFILLVLVTFSNVLNASTLKVTVLDKISFEPIRGNVEFKIYNDSNSYEFKREINDDVAIEASFRGIYKIENIEPGNYDFDVFRVGYLKKVIENIDIEKDTVVELIFYLNPTENKDLILYDDRNLRPHFIPIKLKKVAKILSDSISNKYLLLPQSSDPNKHQLMIKWMTNNKHQQLYPLRNTCYSPISQMMSLWTYYYLFDKPYVEELNLIFDECGKTIFPLKDVISGIPEYYKLLLNPEKDFKYPQYLGELYKPLINVRKTMPNDNYTINLKKQLWISNEKEIKDSIKYMLDSVFQTEIKYFDTLDFPENLKKHNFSYKDRLVISQLFEEHKIDYIIPQYKFIWTESIDFNLNIIQPSSTINYNFNSSTDKIFGIPIIVMRDSLISYYKSDNYEYYKIDLNNYLSLKIYKGKDDISMHELAVASNTEILQHEIEKYSGLFVFPKLNINYETYPNRILYNLGIKSLFNVQKGISTSMFTELDTTDVNIPFIKQFCNLSISSGKTKCEVDNKAKLQALINSSNERVEIIDRPFIYKIELNTLGDLIVGAYAGPTDK